MRIYIPTYGRSFKQVTLSNLPPALQFFTTLVVQERESHLYDFVKNTSVKITILPPTIKTIGPTRDWIIQHHLKLHKKDPKIVMLDDDIKFDTRRKDDPGKFLTATPAEILLLFETLAKTLSAATHAGVLAREGGNRVRKPYIFSTRMMRVLAYNLDLFPKNVSFSRVPLMEDFDVTLQLLRLRHSNVVLCDWVQGQGSSNAPGGCSSYRTLKLQERSANMLRKLHPKFVKVVKKKTKGAWNGQERTDVMVQWKKAYESNRS